MAFKAPLASKRTHGYLVLHFAVGGSSEQIRRIRGMGQVRFHNSAQPCIAFCQCEEPLFNTAWEYNAPPCAPPAVTFIRSTSF